MFVFGSLALDSVVGGTGVVDVTRVVGKHLSNVSEIFLLKFLSSSMTWVVFVAYFKSESICLVVLEV